MKIAMTTLSLKTLCQDKEHFAKLAVNAIMRMLILLVLSVEVSNVPEPEPSTLFLGQKPSQACEAYALQAY